MITIWYCTTEYPAPPKEVNLRAMQTMSHAFGVSVGYSDHTNGITIPVAAVSMGASVIEKHLTLDKNLPGPDHIASLEPNEFTEMVQAIRVIEDALGDGIKRPTSSEINNKNFARKSLVAKTCIVQGDIFSPSNITTKRPGIGISPMRWDDYIGQKSTRNYQPDELLD